MGNSPSKLSIIIPAYNEKAYIRRLVSNVIDAALPQALSREIIIVDDGSEDGTQRIVKDLTSEHPGMISAIFQERNQGKGAALTRGIDAANGDYIITLAKGPIRLADGVEPGDIVTLHWNWVCERISAERLEYLRRSTATHIDIANDRLELGVAG
jgi:glycosyltransferase involved in cell wall biosynthesis